MAKIVLVESEGCISCGLCVSLAPEVFKFVDGKSFAYDQTGAPEKKIQECIDGCPVNVIHWTDVT